MRTKQLAQRCFVSRKIIATSQNKFPVLLLSYPCHQYIHFREIMVYCAVFCDSIERRAGEELPIMNLKDVRSGSLNGFFTEALKGVLHITSLSGASSSISFSAVRCHCVLPKVCSMRVTMYSRRNVNTIRFMNQPSTNDNLRVSLINRQKMKMFGKR